MAKLLVTLYVSMQSVMVAVRVVAPGATYVTATELPQFPGEAGTVA